MQQRIEISLLLRRQHDLLDQSANELHRLVPVLRVIQQALQLFDRLAVHGRKVWQRIRLLRLEKLAGEMKKAGKVLFGRERPVGVGPCGLKLLALHSTSLHFAYVQCAHW
jgi:hypothetical protein